MLVIEDTDDDFADKVDDRCQLNGSEATVITLANSLECKTLMNLKKVGVGTM